MKTVPQMFCKSAGVWFALSALSACQIAPQTHYCGIPTPTPTPDPSGTAHDQFGGIQTVAMAIISEPLGAVIELNGELQGVTPCIVRVPCTKDGDFPGKAIEGIHLAGTTSFKTYILQASPRSSGYSQTKVFKNGDHIPTRVYFNMNLRPVSNFTPYENPYLQASNREESRD